MQKEKPDLSQRTKEFSLRIIKLTSSLPRNREADVLGKQVLRSGTSIGANYREAQRARSKAEFLAKVGDSLKEAEETTYWLELLTESGLVAQNQMAALLDESRQLTAILVTILNRGKENAQ